MSKGKDPLAPVPEPRPNRRDSVNIVDAIVAAALELGDPEASLNEIAARAGVGIASLYRYFPNRSAIHAEISRRLQRDALERIMSVLGQPALSIAEAVEACCRIAVVVPGVSPEMRRALNLSLPLSWSEDNARIAFRTAIQALEQWLALRLAAPPHDLRDRIFVAFASARGLVSVSRMMPEDAPSEEKLIAMMVRGVMAYLDLPPFIVRDGVPGAGQEALPLR